MNKIDKNIDQIFSKVQEMNGKSSDIKTRKINQNGLEIGILFLQSVSSDDKISDILIHSIMELLEEEKIPQKDLFQVLFHHLYNGTIKEITSY